MHLKEQLILRSLGGKGWNLSNAYERAVDPKKLRKKGGISPE
jgi:hypothetical protein